MELVNKIDLFLKESADNKLDLDKPFVVTQKGGSIGSGKGPRYKGEVIVSTHDSLEDARETAKRRNKSLSPGEKGYYGMKYKAGPLTKKSITNVD